MFGRKAIAKGNKTDIGNPLNTSVKPLTALKKLFTADYMYYVYSLIGCVVVVNSDVAFCVLLFVRNFLSLYKVRKQ